MTFIDFTLQKYYILIVLQKKKKKNQNGIKLLVILLPRSYHLLQLVHSLSSLFPVHTLF